LGYPSGCRGYSQATGPFGAGEAIMTVAELKEELSKIPDDYIVVAFEQGQYYDVERVRIKHNDREIEVM
jgi:hypothetical protein